MLLEIYFDKRETENNIIVLKEAVKILKTLKCYYEVDRLNCVINNLKEHLKIDTKILDRGKFDIKQITIDELLEAIGEKEKWTNN